MDSREQGGLVKVVLDASYVIEAYLESSGQRIEALRHEDVVAPTIYVDECRNAVLRKIRQGAVSRDAGLRALDQVIYVPDSLHSASTESVMDMAFDHGLSAFDATYVALALERADGIATLDEQVHRAAKSLGLVVFS